jgi:hypothetical protein
VNLIKEKSFLFKKMNNVSLVDYVKYFEERSDDDFFIFPTMLPYNITIVDKYKTNIFNTMFIPNSSGMLSMHTLLQISPTFHVLLFYSSTSDNKKTALYATIYTTDPKNFRNFLTENESLIIEDETPLGFLNSSDAFGFATNPKKDE